MMQKKKGVDFVLQHINGKIIPIEVSIGKKDKRQIKKAMKKYKSEYGIIISKNANIRKEDDIIYIPLNTFAFM